MKTILGLLVLIALSAFAGDDAEATYKQGLEALRQSQENHSALVPATKLLAKAAAMFEAAGDEARVQEVNSCLYWAKKKMTLADTNLLKGESVAVRRIESASKPIAPEQAATMLANAESFASKADPLLAAIRFFEVADRFPETPEGRKAMSQSLQAMAKVATEKPKPYKPDAKDGKAYLVSDPPGASILVVTPEGVRETGAKTPSLVQLPKGSQIIELQAKKYKAKRVTIEVGESIAKPDKLVLDPFTVAVDVVFEQGWLVFVDGKPSKATTPCTIELPLGTHEVGMAKEGYQDIRQRVDVVDGVKPVEPKAKPTPGPSQFFAAFPFYKLAGTWAKGDNGSEFVIGLDGSIVKTVNKGTGPARFIKGKCRLAESVVFMDFEGEATVKFNIKQPDLMEASTSAVGPWVLKKITDKK